MPVYESRRRQLSSGLDGTVDAVGVLALRRLPFGPRSPRLAHAGWLLGIAFSPGQGTRARPAATSRATPGRHSLSGTTPSGTQVRNPAGTGTRGPTARCSL